MLVTLTLTILVEAALILGYARHYQKPRAPLLLTSVGANIVTQSLLWIVLSRFFNHYLAALILTEVLIWPAEGFMLWAVPANRLLLREALWLSLLMNATSFTLGCFLPI